MEIQEIEEKIGYTFKNKEILQAALTHVSYQEREQKDNKNERLEFLGDAILNYTVTLLLFKKFKEENAGFLSNARSILVRREMLTEIAKNLELQNYLLFSGKKDSIEESKVLSNILEALIGAIFIDGGMRKAESFIRRFFLPYTKERDLKKKDPKNLLQEFTQRKWKLLPRYKVKKKTKEGFVVSVSAREWKAEGRGKTKKEAEEMAASSLFEILIKETANIC